MRWHLTLSIEKQFLYFILALLYSPVISDPHYQYVLDQKKRSSRIKVCERAKALNRAGAMGGQLSRQVKHTVGGSSTIMEDTYSKRFSDDGRPSTLLRHRRENSRTVLMMVPPCGWFVLLLYIRTAHIFTQQYTHRERERGKITSSDYSVFGTGFYCCGALLIFFGGALSFHSLSGEWGEEGKKKKTRVIEFALTFWRYGK